MPIVTVANLRHNYGTHVVLDGATFSIEPDEKIGLVGRNGGGKSTLMKIIAGQFAPDGGSVQMQRSTRIGYLSQEPRLDPEETLRGAAEAAFKELHDLHRELDKVFEDMATADEAALDRLLKRQADLEGRIDAAGGYAIDHKVDATLHGLGFTDDQFSLRCGALSGGERGRLGLARLLLEEPDLLLLDEPTNHLDIAGREWLETFLADEYHGAVIVVSHDRWLLDRVVTRILEVDRGVLREYPGNYRKFLELRRERQLTQARDFEKQMDRVKSEEAFIMRYKAGQRAKQAKGRASRLERFKSGIIDRPMELDVMNLRLPKSPRVGDSIVVSEGLSKRYGPKELFHGLDLRLAPGDRVGIIGPNGAGKTTLVRAILGEIPVDEGVVKMSPRASIGYLRQTHDHLDPRLTIWEYLQSVIVSLDGAARASEQQARDLAGAFLFSGGEQEKVIGNLSGGEKMRMVLAGLMASAKNLMVLDEPTNHLDIPSAERLEDTLAKDEDEGGYDGALLLISHDRALLASTCDRLIVLDGEGNVEVFEGTYTDWQAKRQARAAEAKKANAASARAAAAAADTRKKPEPAPARTAPAKSGAAAPVAAPAKRVNPQNDPMARLAKLTVAELEKQIERTESRIRAIDTQMLDPKVYSDRAALKKLQTERDTLAGELEPLEFEWARRAES